MGIRDDLLLESLSGRSHDAASFEKQRILAAFSLFRFCNHGLETLLTQSFHDDQSI